MPRWRTGVSDRLTEAVCCLTDALLSCGVNFFTSLYMHPMEQENTLVLMRKKEEAHLDVAIHTVSRDISSLDANIALLKDSTATALVADHTEEYQNLKKELDSAELERQRLRYLLRALRGRLDVRRLIPAVKTLSDNVGLQLNASEYINKQVLTLAIQRDLDDAREPVTKVTVQEACNAYGRPPEPNCPVHIV